MDYSYIHDEMNIWRFDYCGDHILLSGLSKPLSKFSGLTFRQVPYQVLFENLSIGLNSYWKIHRRNSDGLIRTFMMRRDDEMAEFQKQLNVSALLENFGDSAGSIIGILENVGQVYVYLRMIIKASLVPVSDMHHVAQYSMLYLRHILNMPIPILGMAMFALSCRLCFVRVQDTGWIQDH